MRRASTDNPDVAVSRSNSESTAISRDEIFTVLSNRRRRRVLRYIAHRDADRVEFRSLVDALSELEYGTTADDLSWKERKRVYTALRQSHLPKLADAGAIEFDESRGTVALTDHTDEFQVYLEYVPEDDISWSTYYLGLTAIGATMTGLTWLSVAPFEYLSGLALSAILVATVGVSAVVHTYYSRQSRLEFDDPT